MKNEEIQREIAEIRGWKPCPENYHPEIRLAMMVTDNNPRPRIPPNWPGDLNAAVELCAGLRVLIFTSKDGWRICLETNDDNTGDGALATDESPARAICIAFLKLNGKWKE